ncbi:MAG TPA: prepilin-type N-terminal cleavage/methylation domain-containing protein [Candidatus Omnitrophota bacterium]|nr:prepilin-type N-terminal cleavage/methylation domain-containing protein [Candidatus Omnitrophota bacterium]
MTPTRKIRCGGFTLLEALIAILIAGLMLIAAMTVLRAEISAYRKLDRSSGELFELRLFWTTLEREFRNMIPYSKAPFSGKENRFSFSTVLVKYDAGSAAETPSRVTYQYDERGLTRRETPLRSLLSSEDGSVKKIIPSLKKFIVEYAYRESNHPEIYWGDSWESDQGLPRGVRITLSLKIADETEKKDRGREFSIAKEFYNPQGSWGWREKGLS